MQLIEERLQPGGIFLFNHLSLTKKDKALAKTYYEDIFLPFYPKATYMDVHSNYVLLNDQKFLSTS